jgi:hypothetical protein
MRIEGRDLVDFGERHFHLERQRGEMKCGQITVLVLDQMQMLDQQIAFARTIGQQCLHIGQCTGIDLTALGRARRTAAATTRGGWSRGRPLLCNAHHLHPLNFKKNASESTYTRPRGKSYDR